MRIGVGWLRVAGRMAGRFEAIDQEELTGNLARKGCGRVLFRVSLEKE